MLTDLRAEEDADSQGVPGGSPDAATTPHPEQRES
jgi:hypothetical protein